MKIEKKHWMIIAIVAVIIIALWYFFMRKKPASNYAGTYGSFGNESDYTRLNPISLDRTIPMPSTGVCPEGFQPGANSTYCKPTPRANQGS